MSESPTHEISPDAHRRLAVDCFNAVWRLMDKPERTQEESDTMLHQAHASRYHWGVIGAPVNLVRGEWQVSRVYAVLGRAEPALYHARRCLEICEANQIGDFDLAFAYEALARAYAIAGDRASRDTYIERSQQASGQITEEEDRELLASDLRTIPEVP